MQMNYAVKQAKITINCTLSSWAFTLLGYLSDLFKKSAASSNKKLTTSNTMSCHMMR